MPPLFRFGSSPPRQKVVRISFESSRRGKSDAMAVLSAATPKSSPFFRLGVPGPLERNRRETAIPGRTSEKNMVLALGTAFFRNRLGTQLASWALCRSVPPAEAPPPHAAWHGQCGRFPLRARRGMCSLWPASCQQRSAVVMERCGWEWCSQPVPRIAVSVVRVEWAWSQGPQRRLSQHSQGLAPWWRPSPLRLCAWVGCDALPLLPSAVRTFGHFAFFDAPRSSRGSATDSLRSTLFRGPRAKLCSCLPRAAAGMAQHAPHALVLEKATEPPDERALPRVLAGRPPFALTRPRTLVVILCLRILHFQMDASPPPLGSSPVRVSRPSATRPFVDNVRPPLPAPSLNAPPRGIRCIRSSPNRSLRMWEFVRWAARLPPQCVFCACAQTPPAGPAGGQPPPPSVSNGANSTYGAAYGGGLGMGGPVVSGESSLDRMHAFLMPALSALEAGKGVSSGGGSPTAGSFFFSAPRFFGQSLFFFGC